MKFIIVNHQGLQLHISKDNRKFVRFYDEKTDLIFNNKTDARVYAKSKGLMNYKIKKVGYRG